MDSSAACARQPCGAVRQWPEEPRSRLPSIDHRVQTLTMPEQPMAKVVALMAAFVSKLRILASAGSSGPLLKTAISCLEPAGPGVASSPRWRRSTAPSKPWPQLLVQRAPSWLCMAVGRCYPLAEAWGGSGVRPPTAVALRLCQHTPPLPAGEVRRLICAWVKAADGPEAAGSAHPSQPHRRHQKRCALLRAPRFQTPASGCPAYAHSPPPLAHHRRRAQINPAPPTAACGRSAISA